MLSFFDECIIAFQVKCKFCNANVGSFTKYLCVNKSGCSYLHTGATGAQKQQSHKTMWSSRLRNAKPKQCSVTIHIDHEQQVAKRQTCEHWCVTEKPSNTMYSLAAHEHPESVGACPWLKASGLRPESEWMKLGDEWKFFCEATLPPTTYLSRRLLNLYSTAKLAPR